MLDSIMIFVGGFVLGFLFLALLVIAWSDDIGIVVNEQHRGD